MIINFHGDIHGHVKKFAQNMTDHPADLHVQVGDFGLGFIPPEIITEALHDHHEWLFIRGNHDDPGVAAGHFRCISDGGIMNIDGVKIMFVGGANSIDKYYRIPGVSWWENEECSYEELHEIICKYEQEKPDIMVTHDCPSSVSMKMFIEKNRGSKLIPTRTGQALQTMFESHQPKKWIFGHWHGLMTETVTETITGTGFTCVDELSVHTLDTEELV